MGDDGSSAVLSETSGGTLDTSLVTLGGTSADGEGTSEGALVDADDVSSSSDGESSTGAVPECEDPSWWNGNYRHRVHFEIDDAVATETLANFPVLLLLDPAWFDYAAAAPGGDDLRFRGPNGGAFALPYEIDHWEEGGISAIWIEYPELPWSDGRDTSDFWLYYGNPDAPPGSDGSDVFNRYFAVNHMSGASRDSVGSHPAVPFENDDGYDYGVPDTCAGECEPLIGEARSFDADEKDALMLADSTRLTFTSGERLSASLWVRTTNLDRVTGWMPILSKAETSWRIQQYENTNEPSLDFDCKLDPWAEHSHCGEGADQHGNYHVPAVGANIGDGDWHHVAVSFSWPPGQRWFPEDRPLLARIFVDGVLYNEREFVDPEGDTAAIYGAGSGYPITLAMKADQPAGRFFDGEIDEVRIAGDEFSPAWFSAEHDIVRMNVVQATEWETCPPVE